MLEDSTVGICASKVLFDDERAINSAGDGLTTAAVGFNRGLGKDGELFMDPEFVFGACGAAVLYRRPMLNEIGFLDDEIRNGFIEALERVFYGDGWFDYRSNLTGNFMARSRIKRTR